MRAALGFRTRKAGALEIVRAVLDMGAKLLLHLRIHLRTPEQSGHAEANRGVSYFLHLRGEPSTPSSPQLQSNFSGSWLHVNGLRHSRDAVFKAGYATPRATLLVLLRLPTVARPRSLFLLHLSPTCLLRQRDFPTGCC